MASKLTELECALAQTDEEAVRVLEAAVPTYSHTAHEQHSAPLFKGEKPHRLSQFGLSEIGAKQWPRHVTLLQSRAIALLLNNQDAT